MTSSCIICAKFCYANISMNKEICSHFFFSTLFLTIENTREGFGERRGGGGGGGGGQTTVEPRYNDIFPA